VVSKLADAEAAFEQEGEKFEGNVKALKAAPIPRRPDQIRFARRALD
jgi:hypothetical protein